MRISKKICSALIIALVSLMIASNARVTVAWLPPKVLIDARSAGWGEHGGFSDAINMLTTNGYTVDLFTTGTITLSLLQQYCCFVIESGDQGYSTSEINDILAFVNSGGGLLFLGEWGGKFTDPSAESIISQLGVTLNDDTIYDPTNYETYTYWPRIHTFPTAHPVTSGVTVFTLGASATLDVNAPAVIIATGDGDTYTVADPPGNTEDGAGDASGTGGSFEPVLAVSTYGSGKAVIFGDSNPFDSGSFNGITRADNAQLWLNIFLWMCPPIDDVIPEYPMGTILGAISMFALLLSFRFVGKRKRIN